MRVRDRDGDTPSKRERPARAAEITAHIGPPLELRFRGVRSRVGQNRRTFRFEFEVSQKGWPAYFGDQTATFLRYPSVGE
jgi:hypothetical protein